MYHELREAANIFIKDEVRTRLFGLQAYGVPIDTKGERIKIVCSKSES